MGPGGEGGPAHTPDTNAIATVVSTEVRKCALAFAVKWLVVRRKSAMRHITDFGNSTQLTSARPSYSAHAVVERSM
jgi:hypothetical protein